MDEWNFLGYAMDEDPVPPDWENEIEQAKKKRTKMVERLLAD